MKKIFFISFVILFSYKTSFAENNFDTTVVIDGILNDWNIAGFEHDKETTFDFGIKNDDNNIYFALRIPDQAIQIKVMSMGMKLFIDTKGKKKEKTGIEFPIPKENFSLGRSGNRFENDQNERPSPVQIRRSLASNLINYKSFGMIGLEDDEYSIQTEENPTIAFYWDENNVMFLEYKIPAKFLGGIETLKTHTISLGFLVNGIEMLQSNSTNPMVASKITSRPSGSSNMGGGGRRPGGSGGNSANMDKMMKELSSWTKYTVN